MLVLWQPYIEPLTGCKAPLVMFYLLLNVCVPCGCSLLMDYVPKVRAGRRMFQKLQVDAACLGPVAVPM